MHHILLWFDVKWIICVCILFHRFYLLKRMAKPCTALVFHPYMENMLFLATAATKIYRINAGKLFALGSLLPDEYLWSCNKICLLFIYFSSLSNFVNAYNIIRPLLFHSSSFFLMHIHLFLPPLSNCLYSLVFFSVIVPLPANLH